jgi:large subunit ribosomal protein L13
MVKTYTPKETDIERRWWLVDAEGLTLGRLATRVASLLRGKHRPEFSPHLDLGDFVVVVNADKIAVTGNRLQQKMYYRHSGYPGGLKARTMEELMAYRPERVIRLAVKGMLPHNRLGRRMFGKLKVYAGPDHPHAAQQPVPLDIMAFPNAAQLPVERREGADEAERPAEVEPAGAGAVEAAEVKQAAAAAEEAGDGVSVSEQDAAEEASS